ncbi:MAG: hypothetical protein F2789_15715 [Actinobacteria bacterium]|nr:hypothetical protein [Actinomycetota bacterium]
MLKLRDLVSIVTRRRTALGIVSSAVVASTAVTTYRDHGNIGDWHFFAEMSRQLTSRHGLLVYAEHPDIQSGPLSLLTVRLLDALGSIGFPIAIAVLGVITVLVLERTRPHPRRSELPFLLGGVLFALWWPHVHVWGHIDDAIVLTLASVLLLLMLRGKPIPAAVVLGLMLAVKPWAVFLVPLLAWRGAPGWRRFRPTMVCLAVGGALWSPFVIASIKTIDGFRPHVDVAPDSVLNLFGVAPDHVPSGLRFVQLGLAIAAVAAVTLWRDRPAGALLAGVAVRLALEPATWNYYTVGFIVGAFMWDMSISTRRVPWATAAAFALLPPALVFQSPDLRAVLRLVACVGALAIVLWPTRGTSSTSRAVQFTLPDTGWRPVGADTQRD